MIDWLEEILKAAEELEAPEKTAEPLTPFLNRVNAALSKRIGPIHGEDTENEPSAVGRGQTRPGASDAGSRAEENGNEEGLSGSELLYRRSTMQPLYVRERDSSALQGLYRQVRETVGRDPASAGSRVNTVVVREEGAAAAGLTVGEFDRAVRRDSRRYDGGMSIY